METDCVYKGELSPLIVVRNIILQYIHQSNLLLIHKLHRSTIFELTKQTLSSPSRYSTIACANIKYSNLHAIKSKAANT